MTTPESAEPNAEQSQCWNEIAGPNWVALEEALDEELAPLGAVAMDRAEVAPGERVLDTGCGCGQTSLELARRVGPGGFVLGIDISTPMLERAGTRAKEADIAHIRFENADAQTYAFAPSEFDLLYSRMGVMFFDDPLAAFSNQLRALRPGGRLAFVCWRDIKENPWMSVTLSAVAKHIPIPERPPGAPGPFAFADSRRVGSILKGAGFANVAFEGLDTTITVGGSGSLDESVGNILNFGLISRALRQADVQDTTEIAASVREAVAPYATTRGVRLGSACWVVTGRRP
jgi:SAM-dependent methyltransferase